MRDLLGVTAVDLGGGAKAPSAQLYADFDGPMVPDAFRLYKDVGKAIAKAVMANATQKAKFITCDPAAAGTAGTTCLTNTIKTFGRKAFRRPLTDAEVTRFLKLNMATPAGTPAEVTEAILYAFLVSPSFISLPEVSTATPSGSGFQLTSHEVAQRLSFMLWGSVPDDALSTAADANQLADQGADPDPGEPDDRHARQDDAARAVVPPPVGADEQRQRALVERSTTTPTKFPLYNTTTSKTSLQGGAGQLLRGGRVHERRRTRTSS